MPLRTLVVSVMSAVLLSIAAAQPQRGADAYATLRAEAERYVAEKSFRRANELYAQAATLKLAPADERWVRFRLADTAWRADAAAPANDPTEREAARKTLEALAQAEPAGRIAGATPGRAGRIAGATPGDDNRVRAEANESLGDYHARHNGLYAGVQWYVAALDFWAGSSEIEMARGRYLALVRKFASVESPQMVPRHVLTNAIEIARTGEDRAWTRMLLAMQLMYERQPDTIERALELFASVIALGRGSEWYDDALFQSANLLSWENDVVSGDDSGAPDYVRAIALYRRLVTEFAPGESRFRREAEQRIDAITKADVAVHAAGTFLPGSEQQVLLTWRNVKAIELAIYSVDLTGESLNVRKPVAESISLSGRTAERRWTFDTNDDGRHHPGSKRLTIDPQLPAGAWILTAQAGGVMRTELVLVSDAHILVHQGRERMEVFVSDVVTGQPIPKARVRVSGLNGNARVERSAVTDERGLASVDVTKMNTQLLIAASAGAARQAWHSVYQYSEPADRASMERWRIYAFTDRPAYRPAETVSWKIIARTKAGERWATPAGQTVDYEIVSPRGEKVHSGAAKLNSYGAAWGELALTASMPLGVYHVTFRVAGARDEEIGNAQLFRLEEYKLPEFTVRVTTPEGKQYRLGDTIEASIEASYYFGGPVANATVTAVIYQQPFQHHPWPVREYGWYFPRESQYYRGGDSIVREETLRTDANGRATLRIDTQRDGSHTTWRIEARVVDASRREVRGEGTVRVMKQRYAVTAQPEHYVHRPGVSASIEFLARDSSDRPVKTTGTVKVVRRRWKKSDLVVSGPRPVRSSRRGFIAPPVPEGEYVETDVLTTQLSTDAAGKATLTFTPKETGYYTVRWSSLDIGADAVKPKARDLVKVETSIWVAERATTDLGYRTGGLDLIVDRETVLPGETASLIVVTPASGRWVLLTTSGDDIIDTQVIHLDGTVKLVQIPVDDRHVPNFFATVSSVFEREVVTDSERIVVPPAEQFIDVAVSADRGEYRPREEGTFTITTRDSSGKPVAAEVALSVTDDAVAAIQEDLAGDPRPFFFGEVRQPVVQVSAALHQQRFLEVDQIVVDEREEGIAGGVAGAVAGDSMSASPPPTAPSPVAQSITVTAESAMLRKTASTRMDGSAANAVPAVGVVVRSDFRSTAFWKPDVTTDATGRATVKVRFPESLTTWRATARAATIETQIGMASSTVRTNMPLMARLQAPRFFVAGDRALVSAIFNNDTSEAMTVTPSLELDGLELATDGAKPLIVPAHGEAAVGWTVNATRAGNARLKITGRSASYADSMERSFVVWEHGIDKLVASSGKLRGTEAMVRLDLPRARRATDLTVQIAPSLATAMLDALPYLFEFPYGCTEQTMSRFLPAATVARTLEKLGLSQNEIHRRITAGGSPSLAVGGRSGDVERKAHSLDQVTKAGMSRLYDMQHDDGGWGWWKEGSSDAWMTAYVVWGFSIAREGGLDLRSAAVDRGAEWLERRLVESESQIDDQAWMLHALASWRAKPSANERRALENLWTKREGLSAYGRALFALTAHRWNDAEKARVLVRNLEGGAQIDKSPDRSLVTGVAGSSQAEVMATAHWGSSNRFWWRWHEGPVETTAFVLRALVNIDPDHRLVEPAMNWLVKNRRGAQWNNTRDTSIALLALEDYLERSGELAGDASFEITVNGRAVASKSIRRADILGEPLRFTVDPTLLRPETQEIRIRRTAGTAPLYFAAEARFVSLEEPVKAAGNEIFVKREYFRLAPRPTLLKGVQYDRVPLLDGGSVKSGERIEVVLTIDAKNDYQYLIFEDLKPAGFEAVALQSGEGLFATQQKTGQTTWVFQELRDRKVASFIDHLGQGVWELRYTLRAETPGSFHSLPLLGAAMYVPEVRANSDELRVEVE